MNGMETNGARRRARPGSQLCLAGCNSPALQPEKGNARQLLVGRFGKTGFSTMNIAMQTRADNGKLTLAAFAAAKKLPVEFLQREGVHDLPGGGIGFRYFASDGAEIAVKRRMALRAKDGSYWPKGTRLSPYLLNHLDRALREGHLYICEGESDALTLLFHGLPAIGLPGAGSTSCLPHEAIDGIGTVFIPKDADEAGDKFVTGVLKRLAELGFGGPVFVVTMPNGFKDVSDIHVRAPDKFLATFKACVARAQRLTLPNPDDWKPTIPSRNGAMAHRANETPISRSKTGVSLARGAMPSLEPYRPFPLDALPYALAEFVGQCAESLGCDPAFVALPCLTAVAAMIGNARCIQLKRGWTEPPILWTAAIGDSGTLKSPAHAKAIGPVFRIQHDLMEEHKQALADYDRLCDEYEQEKKAAEEKGEEPPKEPEKPQLARVVCSDTTIEKLAELLADNPRGLLVTRDELAGWLGSFSRYKGKAGGTDLPNWLELFRAGTMIVDRKTGERRTIFVPHAAASVTGTIQPGVLARILTPEFLESGLAARLLLAMPPKQVKRWTECEVAPDVETAYREILAKLRKLAPDRDDGKLVPRVLTMSAEAKRAWVAFYNEWAREQQAAEGDLAAAFSKREGYAARFALIHHVVSHVAGAIVDNPDLVPIEKRSVEAGIMLSKWFANEDRRIYAMLAESEEQRGLRRQVEFVQSRGGRITARELRQSNPRKYRTADDAEAALDLLVQSGWAEWQDRPTGDRGGRPTRECCLIENVGVNETPALQAD